MALESEHQSYFQRKGEIINRCSILHAAINQGDVPNALLNEVKEDTLKKFRKTYGGRPSSLILWERIDQEKERISELLIDAGLAEEQKEDPKTQEAQEKLATILILAGFQIGNKDDAFLFLDQLANFVIEFDRLYDEKIFSTTGRSKAHTDLGKTVLKKLIVKQALITGVFLNYLKKDQASSGPSKIDQQVDWKALQISFHPELDFDPGHKPTDVGEVFRRDLEGIDLDLPAIPPDFPDKTK